VDLKLVPSELPRTQGVVRLTGCPFLRSHIHVEQTESQEKQGNNKSDRRSTGQQCLWGAITLASTARWPLCAPLVRHTDLRVRRKSAAVDRQPILSAKKPASSMAVINAKRSLPSLLLLLLQPLGTKLHQHPASAPAPGAIEHRTKAASNAGGPRLLSSSRSSGQGRQPIRGQIETQRQRPQAGWTYSGLRRSSPPTPNTPYPQVLRLAFDGLSTPLSEGDVIRAPAGRALTCSIYTPPVAIGIRSSFSCATWLLAGAAFAFAFALRTCC
jgi:hypothetical protein